MSSFSTMSACTNNQTQIGNCHKSLPKRSLSIHSRNTTLQYSVLSCLLPFLLFLACLLDAALFPVAFSLDSVLGCHPWSAVISVGVYPFLRLTKCSRNSYLILSQVNRDFLRLQSWKYSRAILVTSDGGSGRIATLQTSAARELLSPFR